jgi:hypothetical protein
MFSLTIYVLYVYTFNTFCSQFAATVAAILEILDVAALNEGVNFDIPGGFKSEWRAHAWEGIYFN